MLLKEPDPPEPFPWSADEWEHSLQQDATYLGVVYRADSVEIIPSAMKSFVYFACEQSLRSFELWVAAANIAFC